MEPWQSWAFLLTSGAVLYWYYGINGDKTKIRGTRAATLTQETAANHKKSGGKNHATATSNEPLSSDSGTVTQRASKKKAPKKEKAKFEPLPLTVTPAANEVEEDDTENDKDWAQRLAGNKKGTTLAPPDRRQTKQRTVKQGALHAAKVDISAASSSTGAEADDDMSPMLSPALDPSPSGRDVSDMLEAPAPAPQVLRLTESTKPLQAKKLQKQSAAPVQETKKQRQNRRKVEEAKLLRDEDEKLRRVKMEQQRRGAREARNEPAKNGLQSAKAPSSSAWNASEDRNKTIIQEVPTANTQTATLLDTFDQDSNTSGSNAAPSRGSGTTIETNYREVLPSEEEQTMWAMQDSGWSTVATSKRGKKKTSSSTGDGVESVDGSISQPNRTEPAKAAPAVVVNSPSYTSRVLPSGPSIFEQSSHPNDSDWAVV